MIVKQMNFNGVSFDDLLVVEQIKRPLLPEIESIYAQRPGGDGDVFIRNRLKPITIEVDVRVIGDDWDDAKAKLIALAPKLYTNELASLYLRDRPDLYNEAVLSGETELNMLLNSGYTTLKFYCPNPLLYGVLKIQGSIEGSSDLNFMNKGDYEIRDYAIAIYVNTATSSITVTNKNSGEKIALNGDYPAGKVISVQMGSEADNDVRIGNISIMNECSFTSTFFNLRRGINDISMSPGNGNIQCVVGYQERYF